MGLRGAADVTAQTVRSTAVFRRGLVGKDAVSDHSDTAAARSNPRLSGTSDYEGLSVSRGFAWFSGSQNGRVRP